MTPDRGGPFGLGFLPDRDSDGEKAFTKLTEARTALREAVDLLTGDEVTRQADRREMGDLLNEIVVDLREARGDVTSTQIALDALLPGPDIGPFDEERRER